MAKANAQIVVGRQGIYTADGATVGYELLFRGLARSVGYVSGEEMTAEVIFGAMTIGLDHLVGRHDVFCNANRAVLVGDVPLNLPPERTVVEVLESVHIDDNVLNGCSTLVAEGYRLALDDFVWRPGAERLLPLASVVKIDVIQTVGDELAEIIERCSSYNVQLLAEKVEDLAQIDVLAALGFELFQGFALERPATVAGLALEAGALARVQMATAILSGDPDLDEIEQIVRTDPALALQLIRVASVGRMGETRRVIGTLRHALVMMGSRRVRNWAALLLTRSAVRPGDDERFFDTLVRARACELLAAVVDPKLSHLGFAAGMLSALETQLDLPPEDLCDTVTLTSELVAAAFHAAGPIGAIVSDATKFQLGNEGATRLSGIPDHLICKAFASAMSWAVACSVTLADRPTTSGAA